MFAARFLNIEMQVFIVLLCGILFRLSLCSAVQNDETIDIDVIQLDENPTTSTTKEFGFVHAFVASISVILFSEFGDKTFFIAALMAMRHSRSTVFLGSLSALSLMTIMSAFFGWIVAFFSIAYTRYICVGLFFIFGCKMLKEAYSMPSSGINHEEIEEIHSDIKKKDEKFDNGAQTPLYKENDVETGIYEHKKLTISKRLNTMVSRIYVQSFTMTFLAEWGDRSQLATIVLSAQENIIGIILGGILGHLICTGIAVLCGRFVGKKISVRTVTFIGGVVFILFAVSALIFRTNDTKLSNI